MKKKIILILIPLLLVVVLLICFLIPMINDSRQPDLRRIKNISEKEIEQMNESLEEQHYGYLSFDRDNNEFTYLDEFKMRYYGSFSGCLILFAPHHEHNKTSLKVADSEFTDSSPFSVFVYKKGVFLKLEEAYAIGWLSKRQVKRIAEIHKNFKTE